MAKLVDVKIKANNKTYRLEVSWDGEAFADGEGFNFNVSAEAVGDDGSTESVEVNVGLQVDEEGTTWLKVTAGEVELLSMPVSDLLDTGTVVGRIIEALPVQIIDPLLGCALRAGLSAIVDQLALCCTEVRNPEAGRGLKAAIAFTGRLLRCMRENVLKIGASALLRFAKCFFAG